MAAPTSTVSLLKTFTVPEAKRTPEQKGFGSLYLTVGLISVSVALIGAFIALITAVLQRSGRPMADGFEGLVSWGLFWVAGLAVGALFVEFTDGAAQLLLGAKPGDAGPIDQALVKVFNLLLAVANPATGGMVGLIAVGLLAFGIIGLWIMLQIRDVAMVLVALSLPVLLALRSVPQCRRLLGMSMSVFIYMAVAKPAIIVALRVASFFILANSIGGLLKGVVVLCAAVFVPMGVAKLLGASQNGGSAGAGNPGLGEQLVQTGAQGSNMLQNLVSQGSPAYVKGGGIAGGGKAAAGGKALGGLGPVGVGIAAVTAVGGAMKSGAQSVGSKLTTGGGTVGDPEQARIPHLPHTYPRGSGGGSADGGRDGQRTPPQRPADERTVVRTGPAQVGGQGRPPTPVKGTPSSAGRGASGGSPAPGGPAGQVPRRMERPSTGTRPQGSAGPDQAIVATRPGQNVRKGGGR